MRVADAVVLLIVLWIVWSFYQAHKSPGNAINLFDLVMVDGRLSKMAVVFMGAFATTTWAIIRLTIDGKLTEGYVGLYSTAWVAPMISRLFANPPASVTTTTASSSTTQEIK